MSNDSITVSTTVSITRPRVILTRRWPAACEAALAQTCDVLVNAADEPMDRDALVRALRSCDALGATVTDRIDGDMLADPARRAGMIGNFGVGFNHIDIDAARRCGVLVSNTPGVLTDATADLAMTLILMCARRAGEGERLLRAGAWQGWSPTSLLGTQVSGATLGIIGMGRIGEALARRAALGFGMRVLYHNRSRAPQAELALGATWVSLKTLLETADFVSLNCPSNAETHHLIDAEALVRMRPSAFLVNTARGDVVDEAALAEALRVGRIAGAGLDVYEHEPEVHSGLLSLENVVLLPHQGSGTAATREAMGNMAVANIRAFLDGRPIENPVV